MRAWFTLAALGASAAALIGLGAATASNAATAGKTVTFHLVEKDKGFNYIDNPPKQGPKAPPLIGDQFAFASELLTKTGAHAGWVEATCMVALGGTRGEGPCYGVFRLAGGTLMAMARTTFYGDAPNHIVIVGGTGVYQGVTGEILSVTTSESTNADTVTLHWS
jgi:hypothetical protein